MTELRVDGIEDRALQNCPPGHILWSELRTPQELKICAGAARWRWLAAVPSVLGFAIAMRCVWDFGWTGHGTPAPVAPPKRLVVVGFYRYLRNPMYVGFAAGWIGLWVVFGHANPALITAVAAVALAVHLFVVFYEAPTLRKKFGADYDEYCRDVNRWWPRVRGWDKPQ